MKHIRLICFPLCLILFGCGSGTPNNPGSKPPTGPSLTFAAIAAHTYGDAPFTVTASSASTSAITYTVTSGPAAISGNTVTLSGAGTVTLTAIQAADATYTAASAQTSFTVAKGTASITFTAIPAHAAGDAPFAPGASSASTGAITYSVVSGPAIVSTTSTGTLVKITGAGTVTLMASQAADANFVANTALTSFAVAVGHSIFTFGVIPEHEFGDPPFVVAASSASTGTVTYSVASGPATLSGNLITLTGAGTVILAASQAADANYFAATTQTSFLVDREDGTLSFAAGPTHTYGDAPFTVSASSSTTSSAPITYALLSGPATLSGSTLTITGAGTITVSASQAGDQNYSPVTAQNTYTILKAVAPLTFAPIAAHSYSDPPFTISAASVSTGAMTYSVGSGNATISGNTVTLTGGGPLTLDATQASDANYRTGTAQVSLNVFAPASVLDFDLIASHTYGDPPFTVSASSASTGAITYSVISGPATVSGNTVILSGAGTVIVQASQAADATHSAGSTQTSFVVAKGAATLTFAPITPPIFGDAPFTVSASSASTGNITYNVISGSATIAGNTVTLTGTGDVTLSARQSSDTNYAVATTSTTFTVAVPNTSPVGLVKHVVVIFDENVAFDHYFATYPVATNPAGEPVFTALPNTPAVDGLSGDLLTRNPNASNARNGVGAVNPFRIDRTKAATADQNHGYGAEQMAFDNGFMDLFPLSVGAADGPNLGSGASLTNGLTMGYFDGNTVTALWNYAQYFSMSDHFFGTTFGPSAVGAINLASGQTNGVVNDANAAGTMIADGYGGYTLIGNPDPTNDICSNTSPGLAHLTGKTIGNLLNAANISWGFFTDGFDTTVVNPNGTSGCSRSHTSSITARATPDYIPHHEPFQYYASTANPTHARPSSVAVIGKANDATAHNQYDIHDFFDALGAGNFPAVSFLKPPAFRDGHAGYSDPLDEQTFIVDTLNTLQQNPEWKNTVVLIAYDDSDGWYDHEVNVINGSTTGADTFSSAGKCGDGTTALPGVSPSALHAQGRCGYGPRLPLLAISPWAIPNYVDSNVTDQTSIARFIEDTFLNGQRIGQGSYDGIAGPINGMFDFRRPVPQNLHTVLLNDTTGTVTSVQ